MTTIRARIGHVQPRGKADADPSPRGLLRADDLFSAALKPTYSRAVLSRKPMVRFLRKRVEQAQQALQVANGRNVKGERAAARKALTMAVARLAAAMPAGAA